MDKKFQAQVSNSSPKCKVDKRLESTLWVELELDA